MAILAQHGIPAAPVNSIDQVLSLPQIAARQMVLTLNHPATGKPLPVLGNPMKLCREPQIDFLPPPLLGQHTEEILKGWLGLNDREIAELRQEKVI